MTHSARESRRSACARPPAEPYMLQSCLCSVLVHPATFCCPSLLDHLQHLDLEVKGLPRVHLTHTLLAVAHLRVVHPHSPLQQRRGKEVMEPYGMSACGRAAEQSDGWLHSLLQQRGSNRRTTTHP